MSDDRPVSVVVADIVGNINEIISSEMRLFRAEINTEVVHAWRAGSVIAYGVGLSLYAIGLFLAVVVLLLSRVLDPWAAALVVGVAVALVAGCLIAIGRRRWRQLHPTPDKIVPAVKENVSWMKPQVG